MNNFRKYLLENENHKQTLHKFKGIKLQKWETILYRAFIDYIKDYLKMDKKLKIELKLTKWKANSENFGFVDIINFNRKLPKITLEEGYTELLFSRLLHEMTHVKQVLNNELSYNESYITWNGKDIIRKDGFGELSFENYKSLPWEEEAYRNQDKSKELYKDFQKSIHYTTLSGKNNVLDSVLAIGI